MATMKAWQCRSFSGPVEQNLYLAEIPRPTPSATEVIVEVHSTTINPIDYKILELGLISRTIFRAPVTPGLDISGRVISTGGSVSAFKPGDVVFGSCNGVFGHGALAQYIAVSQDTLAHAPSAAQGEETSAIATVGMTTLQALRPYVKAGSNVFINGGSGGTGVLAIQIAKALGCHVTASCSSANAALCTSLGADAALDYKAAPIVQQLAALGTRFDVVLDNVGLGMDWSALRQFVCNLALPSFLGGGKAKYVFAVTKPNRADFELLAKWMEGGEIRAVLDEVYGFGSAPQAFAKLKTGRARGKIVVRVKEA